MAKYTATYKCGHSSEISLFGKHTDRDNRLAYLSGVDCPACIKKALEEANRIENEKAASLSSDLPTLTGSDKQIAWANTIRIAMLDNIDSFTKLIRPERAKQGEEMLDTMRSELLANTEASYFIDNRGWADKHSSHFMGEIKRLSALSKA